MKPAGRYWLLLTTAGALAAGLTLAHAQQAPRGKSSYMPVDITEPFSTIMSRLSAEKPAVEREHMAVLNERYDLSNRPAAGVTMDHAKPVQEGVRVKLPAGATWDGLAGMTPEQIRDRNLFPLGFLPLPHPKHQEGGMVFPRFEINEIKRQEGRDLTRFDVDFDIPDHFLPEFPPAIYLNQRSDLGDVSQGKLITIENYYELFNGIIPPKQLEGLRLHKASVCSDRSAHSSRWRISPSLSRQQRISTATTRLLPRRVRILPSRRPYDEGLKECRVIAIKALGRVLIEIVGVEHRTGISILVIASAHRK